MSTDWNVHCLDCNDTHNFSDANHSVPLMRSLIRHAAALGGLAPIRKDLSYWDLEVRTHHGPIDLEWFQKHAAHRLVPINEYGGFDDECGERFDCSAHREHTCHLPKGHEGAHDGRRS